MRPVLIIEDDPDSRHLLRLRFEMAGTTVLDAPDGTTGLRLALEHRPACVIVDFGLPDVDGCTVAQRIRAADPERATRLVALTGFDREADRARARAAGFDEYLVKPVESEVLDGLIERALAR